MTKEERRAKAIEALKSAENYIVITSGGEKDDGEDIQLLSDIGTSRLLRDTQLAVSEVFCDVGEVVSREEGRYGQG